MVNYINTQRPLWPPNSLRAGQPITVQDVCYFNELSETRALPFHALWEGASYGRKSFEELTGLDCLGEADATRAVGDFDWDSVMLYASSPWFVHFRRDEHGALHHIPGKSFAR